MRPFTYSALAILAALLSVSILVVGCQNSGSQPNDNSDPSERETEQAVKVIADTTVQATVRQHISTAWCGEDLGSTVVWVRADNIYRYENCEEIQETLEVADVKAGKDAKGNTVTAAFLRYSIGTKVFRKVFWYRKVGNRYAYTTNHPSTYSNEEDWNAEALKIAEEADSWKEGSATWNE